MKSNAKIHLLSFVSALFLCILCACNNSSDVAYDVETSELDSYAQKFFSYATQYGYDFSNDGLIMRFADLSDGTAGQCYMNRIPIYIEIDYDYWTNTLTGKGNEADLKEDLIFHEMGHGFLQRLHTNVTLANSEWKSIMCGDELPNNRSSNISYRGMRKDYYIQELFDSTATAPWWSTYSPDFSSVEASERTLMIASGESRYWYTVSNDTLSAAVSNNQYVITNNLTSSNFLIPINFSQLDASGNFYFEATIQTVSTAADSSVYGGIYVGNPNTADYHYLLCNNDNKIMVSKTNCLPFVQLYTTDLAANTANKIAIRRQADSIYIYQNDTFMYHYELGDFTMSGNSIGFYVGSASSLYVTNATIKSSSSILRQMPATKPEIVAVEDIAGLNVKY